MPALLAAAGFVAAEDEAVELVAAAAGDAVVLDAMLQRRLEGEPLAWITGRTRFCGIEVVVDEGVYVPRWHSERLARQAAELLPADGVGLDLCTGTGALAMVLAEARPQARVVAADIDDAAVACARRNGVEAYLGDLFAPLPEGIEGVVDVIAAVVPYVPTPALPLLQRDTFGFETPLPYDGGSDGTYVLRRMIAGSPRFLRPGGHILLELGGDQAGRLREQLAAAGFEDPKTIADDEGDVRGIEAAFAG